MKIKHEDIWHDCYADTLQAGDSWNNGKESAIYFLNIDVSAWGGRGDIMSLSAGSTTSPHRSGVQHLPSGEQLETDRWAQRSIQIPEVI